MILLFCISIPGDSVIRASPMVLGMWFQTVKLDERKSTYAGLAQENGFGSAELMHNAMAGKGRSTTSVHVQKRV